MSLVVKVYGALTRPYRGQLTVPSQLKLADYFPKSRKTEK